MKLYPLAAACLLIYPCAVGAVDMPSTQAAPATPPLPAGGAPHVVSPPEKVAIAPPPPPPANSAEAAVGLWQTVDDHTGKPASVVRTYLEGGRLYGRVEKVLDPSAPPNARCIACSGDLKDQPVVGLRVIWDMIQEDQAWTGGHVLDPKNGKIYGCKIHAIGATELQVRGFIGISLFGRNQTWHRLSNAPGEANLP